MALYEVTKIKRTGDTGNRIAIVQAKTKKEAAVFVARIGKTKRVRVFPISLKKVSDKRKTITIFSV